MNGLYLFKTEGLSTLTNHKRPYDGSWSAMNQVRPLTVLREVIEQNFLRQSRGKIDF